MSLDKALKTWKVSSFMGEDSLPAGSDINNKDIDELCKTINKCGIQCKAEIYKISPETCVIDLEYKYPTMITDDSGMKYCIGVWDKKHPERAKKKFGTLRLNTTYCKKTTETEWGEKIWCDMHLFGAVWKYGKKDKVIIDNPKGVIHLHKFDNWKQINEEVKKSLLKLKSYIDNGEPLMEEI